MLIICICAGCFFYILEDILMVISINYRKEENWKIINDNLANLEAQNTVSICNYFLAASEPFFYYSRPKVSKTHTKIATFRCLSLTTNFTITLNILNMRNYLYMNMIYDSNLVNNVNLPTTIATLFFLQPTTIMLKQSHFRYLNFIHKIIIVIFYKSWKYIIAWMRFKIIFFAW